MDMLRQLGLRTKKSILRHLLLENTYDSNLVPDISKCDYLRGHLGRTDLQPLDGLPMFVDDLYVFGYLSEEDLWVGKGKALCNNAKDIVSRISLETRNVFDRFCPTAILHSIAKHGGDSIPRTIRSIELADNTARRNWQERNNAQVAGYFVAKVDVSEIAFEEVWYSLRKLQRLLETHGMGIYSIDYTQDFSGTLDREALVEHLLSKGFVLEGEGVGTILQNTNSVGKHVCTFLQDNTRTKLYNKIVSNFEAGEVQNPLGSHLAEYVDCPNKHLRKTFQHPDVQARGCTRMEISVYGCTKNRGRIEDTLRMVSGNLFVVQPAKNLWKNLARCLDRSCVVADRSTGRIFHAWYGHSKTGRLSGVLVRTKTNKWERAVQWAIADFGFRNCPIYRIDLSEDLQVSLRCYAKDAPTILAAMKRPTQLHVDAPEIAAFLPPTKNVEWVWRTKKCQEIGVQKPAWECVEIETDREIYMLSKRGRDRRMQEIEDAMEQETWKERMGKIRAKELQIAEKERQRRNEETAEVRKKMEKAKKYKENSMAVREEVEETLSQSTKKVSEVVGIHCIWGFRKTNDTIRIALDDTAVYATKGLRKLLGCTAKKFEREEDRFGRKMYWLPHGEFQIEILPTQSFVPADKEDPIFWNAIRVLSSPDPKLKIEEFDCIVEEIQKEKMLQVAYPKDSRRLLELPEGEYKASSYACRKYRGKKRTCLFLYNEETPPTPCYGVFLEKALDFRLADIAAPLDCKVGAIRTTPNKRKCRLATIVALE